MKYNYLALFLFCILEQYIAENNDWEGELGKNEYDIVVDVKQKEDKNITQSSTNMINWSQNENTLSQTAQMKLSTISQNKFPAAPQNKQPKPVLSLASEGEQFFENLYQSSLQQTPKLKTVGNVLPMTVRDKQQVRPEPKQLDPAKAEQKQVPQVVRQPSVQGQPQTARMQPAKKQKAVIPSNLFG